MILTKKSIHSVLLSSGLSVMMLSTPIEANEKPNILFILADDLAWNGVSCYGNEHVSTPNIDRLATEGMKFNRAYAAPVCSPTRAMIISGQADARTGVTSTGSPRPFAPTLTPAQVHIIPESSYTIAEPLRNNGYECAIAGKWHLLRYEIAGAYRLRGQEYFDNFGFNHVSAISEDETPETTKDKAVDALTDYVIEFMEQHQEKPFFAFLSHFTVHHQLNAPDSLIQKYVNRGYPKTNDYYNRPSATYLAMINHLDNSVGRLLDKLEELDIADNTIVIFASDNGGVQNYWHHGMLRGFKGSAYEGGVRVPFIVRWPGMVKAGSVTDFPIQLLDLYPTFLDIVNVPPKEDYPLDGESFFSLLTGGKSMQREAIFMHRPHYQPKYAGTPVSVTWKNDYKLIFYYNDFLDYDYTIAPRSGFYGDLYIGKKVELFNLSDDPGETMNLASSLPDITLEMLDDLKAWLIDKGAELPIPNPNFDPQRWQDVGDLPDFSQPDFDNVFSLADTASVRFEYDPMPDTNDLPRMLFHFPFEGTLTDTSDSTYLLTSINGHEFSEGAYGQGVVLNGINQSLLLDRQGIFDPTISPFTVCAWIYNTSTVEPTASNYPEVVLTQLNDSESGIGRIYLSTIVNNDGFFFSNFMGGRNNFSSPEWFNRNEWVHVAVTFDPESGTITYFVNGEMDTSTSAPAFETCSGAFRIGANKGGGGQFWTGKIDELYLFSVILDSNEIIDIMNNEWTDPTTGISDSKHTMQHVRIFPNPARSHLQIEASEPVYEVSLYNLSGQLICNVYNKTRLNTEHIKPGLYILKVTFEKLVHTEQIVIW
jgi:arylsulfatase A